MLQMQGMERVKIASRDNVRLKLARKARDGQDDKLIFVEGLRLSEEAVRSGVEIKFCIVTADFGKGEREARLLDQLNEGGLEILEAHDHAFASVAETRSPQGVVLICGRPKTDRVTFEHRIGTRPSDIKAIVVLHEVNNPSNLGAVMRAAEAAGVEGVIMSNGSTDVFSPKSLRASMGSAFRLPIWSGADLDEVFEFASRDGYALTAVALNADSAYTEIDWKRPRLLIFGSEAHGLPSSILEKMDEKISIPMDQNVESLNLAVAAGVILFEARRQITSDQGQYPILNL
jgi:TrmH family RNA methyltransferase